MAHTNSLYNYFLICSHASSQCFLTCSYSHCYLDTDLIRWYLNNCVVGAQEETTRVPLRIFEKLRAYTYIYCNRSHQRPTNLGATNKG